MNSNNAIPIISIRRVNKTYTGGFQTLKNITLDILRGEIFVLLGPNGAGKSTLIGVIRGIVNASAGNSIADDHDTVRDYRAVCAAIGLVTQELHTDAFESLWATVNFSRGLFGKPPNHGLVEKVLRDLSLWADSFQKLQDETPADLWTLQGELAPPFESIAEKRWVAENKASPYTSQEKLPAGHFLLTPGVTG